MDRYAKAIMAALVIAYTGYQVARGMASPGGEAILGEEWVDIAASAVTSGLAVWAVPNKQDPPPST